MAGVFKGPQCRKLETRIGRGLTLLMGHPFAGHFQQLWQFYDVSEVLRVGTGVSLLTQPRAFGRREACLPGTPHPRFGDVSNVGPRAQVAIRTDCTSLGELVATRE